MLATERQPIVACSRDTGVRSMPRYRIVPVDGPKTVSEITAIDGASALNVASRMDCPEVDVWEDGKYAFSVRKQGGRASFWQIFQRQGSSAEQPQNVVG